MTTKDKTGEKLVASIRRTRNTVASKSGTTETAAAKYTDADNVTRETNAPAAKQEKSSAKKTPPKSTARNTGGNTQQAYQSGRRVWPD
jgi:hypothetical protein